VVLALRCSPGAGGGLTMAPHGRMTRSALDPTATPPATVALAMSSKSNLEPGRSRREVAQVATQHAEMASTVLMITRCCWSPDASAPLLRWQWGRWGGGGGRVGGGCRCGPRALKRRHMVAGGDVACGGAAW
jgi:hypothetical protein